MSQLGMIAFGQKENDGRGHTHMPNTVQNPVVALGLQETVNKQTSDGQRKTGHVVKEQCTSFWVQFSVRYTSSYLFRNKK